MEQRCEQYFSVSSFSNVQIIKDFAEFVMNDFSVFRHISEENFLKKIDSVLGRGSPYYFADFPSLKIMIFTVGNTKEANGRVTMLIISKDYFFTIAKIKFFSILKAAI